MYAGHIQRLYRAFKRHVRVDCSEAAEVVMPCQQGGSLAHGSHIQLRVLEVPAETAVCEGKQKVTGESQSDPVDVRPRLGTETGVKIIRHAVGTGDPDLLRPEVEIKGPNKNVLSKRRIIVLALEVKVGRIREGVDTRVCPAGH